MRKARGKKKKEVLEKMKQKVIQKASVKGVDPEKVEKRWTEWEKVASYAFNKSKPTGDAWMA
mgnify:CR=1 FL=1